jgi:hypothetical protein
MTQAPTDEEQEAMRHRVALQMLHDPELKASVEKMVGADRARIRYPEAYPE